MNARAPRWQRTTAGNWTKTTCGGAVYAIELLPGGRVRFGHVDPDQEPVPQQAIRFLAWDYADNPAQAKRRLKAAGID